MGLQLGLSAGLRLSLETRCRLRLGAFFQYAPWRLRGQVWVLFRKTQPGDDLRVRTEDVVDDELDLPYEPFRQALPAPPVVLGEPVLEEDDRIPGDPVLPQGGHLVGGLRAAARLRDSDET